MSGNKAAWLKHKQQKPFEIDEVPMPEPKERDVVIRAHALAINPCDFGIQDLGMVWEEFPIIIGCDIAGEVVAVGSQVEKVKKGDRVMAFVERGAFQLFPVADMAGVAKLPDHISYTSGCVLPACFATAEVALFHKGKMELPLPQLDAKPNGKIVLVWGASSAVGSCAVQMLKAAGFEVAAVAGGHNAQYCKNLGADYVFDHKSENVVEEICKALQDKPFAGVYCAIIDNDVIGKCALIASRLGKDDVSRVVGTVLPPVMPYTEPVPDGVRIIYSQCSDVVPGSELSAQMGREKLAATDPIAEYIWGKWLEPALERGIMKCMPGAKVAGQGLENIQAGCDKWAQGVSAMKIVVEIP